MSFGRRNTDWQAWGQHRRRATARMACSESVDNESTLCCEEEFAISIYFLRKKVFKSI